MIRVLIIEDERPAADKLQRLLLSVRPGWQVASTIETVEQAIKWQTNNKLPNLILMDIQLADGICFEIFEQIKVNAPVIFTTAYDEYAIRAFKVNSIDYLLKPIDPQGLEAALAKFEQMQSDAFVPEIDYEALFQLRKAAWRKRFLVKVGPAYVSIVTSDIELFYISERSTFIRTFQGKNYSIDFSLEQVQQQVDQSTFFRINRNYLVNIEAVAKLLAYSGSRLKLKLNSGYKADDLIVSRDKTTYFKRWMDG
ncbi:MAG: response regulator transcription factor [Prolixibacteraceae bacterium]|nr:response regulator transcription factor [Prolixibacteraceae bacterium]MBN2648620.1 response regulator transcription factor [Prolixibacteraceae bacterium]